MASLIITIQFIAVLTAIIIVSICLLVFVKRQWRDAGDSLTSHVIIVNPPPKVRRPRLARWLSKRNSGMRSLPAR